MSAGNKDQPITLQRPVRTPDSMGGFTVAWSDLASVWAAITPKSGREGQDEGRANATFVVVFTIYRRDLTEADRIMWNGRPYNIRGILDAGETKIDMKVEAERGVAS